MAISATPSEGAAKPPGLIEERSSLFLRSQMINLYSVKLDMIGQIELNKRREPVHHDPLCSFYERPCSCEVYLIESAILSLFRARIHPPAVHPRTPSNGAMMLLGIGTGIALPTLA